MRSPHRPRAALTVPLVLLAIGAALLSATPASSQDERRVEVVALRGILDGPYERAIDHALTVAESEGAEAVVLQIDSAGGIDGARAERIIERVLSAPVPVIAWIGPPGAEARHTAALLASSAHIVVMAPGTAFGPVETLDLRDAEPDPESVGDAILAIGASRSRPVSTVGRQALSADQADRAEVVDLLALQLPELLREVDGRTVDVSGAKRTLDTDPDGLAVRFRKTDLVGRVQHAVAQPSIAYLLLLLGLVGLVFELFHPSTGPAGGTGLIGLALGLYGIGVLGGSWLAVALIVVGVAGFCVDLRVEGLGLFTLAGLAMLVAGSLLLFPGPYLKVHPVVLGLGIIGMIAFLVSAMTRVLRDLRAIARGELEVTDPHPH